MQSSAMKRSGASTISSAPAGFISATLRRTFSGGLTRAIFSAKWDSGVISSARFSAAEEKQADGVGAAHATQLAAASGWDVPAELSQLAQRSLLAVLGGSAGRRPDPEVEACAAYVLAAMGLPDLPLLAIIGIVLVHFAARPLLESAGTGPFDDAYYEELPDRIADLVLHGLRGPRTETP